MKLRKKLSAMAHVFNVGGALQELQSPFSATYFKLKAQKVAPTAKNSLADLREQFERLALLADQLESRSRELMQAAPAEPFGFGRASADGRDCSCTCLKRQLTELMAASRDKEDFTKDQILQRLNEIVYPERESSMQDSSRHNDAPYSARSPPQSKVNLGLGASHSNKQQTAACGNSKTSLYSDLLLRDRAEKKASKPQNSPLPSTPVNSNSKTPSAATNSTINYQFGPIKLIRWVKSKLFRTSNSHKSAKSNPSTSSKKRHLFKSGYKKTQADMLSELPLADRRAIEEEEMNHVMLPNSLEVTTLQQIKEKVDLQVGEFRKFLPDAVS